MSIQRQSEPGNRWQPEFVRQLRVRLQLNQTDFGERVGVERQTVSEWEKGKARPSLLNAALLDAMAKEVGFPVPKEVGFSAHTRVSVGTTGTLDAVSPHAVREPAPSPFQGNAELRGRSIEVEALLRYALERQRLLTQALGAPETLSQHATGEELEAATRRQHAADAAAAAARAREA